MPLGDTIAAIATAPGRSERALVRLSGPAVDHVASTLLGAPADEAHARAAAARLSLSDSLHLPVLTLRAWAPRSYTGEDTLEILLPGNPHLVERVLERLLTVQGVRLASPGEFTARAYLNGKLSLDQAEGVAAVIAAENDEQLAAARDMLSGRTGGVYRTWAEELTTLLALVEAGIDFADQEDVVPIAPRQLAARITRLTEDIEAHLGASAGAEVSTTLPRVVLAGPPNAGKSTLFNVLLSRRRAVVSDVAGTTRDVLEEPLDLTGAIPGGREVMLVDIAGLDESLARQSRTDAAAQRQAAEVLERADVVVYCDPAGRFGPLTPARTERPPTLTGGPPTIRVRTKADLPSPVPATSPATPGAAGPASPGIPVCAIDGWNLPVLRRAIADAACARRSAGIAALLPRHRREMSQAALALRDASGAIDGEARALAQPEIIAGSLRAGLDALGELSGRVSPDDVIGRIFATFCIGK
jgi:tRNA modification GTPase